MVKQRTTVKNETGIHARPAGALCQEAQKYKCNITLRSVESDSAVNAKSVLRIMTGAFKYGTTVEICCNGEDELQALEAMVSLIDGLRD